MNSNSFLLPEQLHHAYIIKGDPTTDPFVLRDMLIARKDVYEGSIDTLCQLYDSLSVSDSAFLKNWHSEVKVDDHKRVCIVGAKAINREAENALLKILEEPQEDTHFFFVVPEPYALADTIRSRVHILDMKEGGTSESYAFARAFISASPEKRLNLIEDVIKSHKDDETSGGLRSEALQLLSAVERVLYEERFLKNKSDKKTQKILHEIGQMREYLGQTGASVKMILEHIALML